MKWCRRDAGPIDYLDAFDRRHTADVSLTRDGSVWLRFQSAESGEDSSADWTYIDETQQPLQLSVLEPSVFSLLDDINYTDVCALTDLHMSLAAQSGWHPSYLSAYDPRLKQTRTILFRHNEDCKMSTSVSLSVDRQALVCDGGRKTACGQRDLPERGQRTSSLFLRSVNFDPAGPGHWKGCKEDDTSPEAAPSLPPPHNSYTFYGSYYYAYVKVASCDTPHGIYATRQRQSVIFCFTNVSLFLSDRYTILYYTMYSMVWPTRRIISDSGDDFPSQSLDWY